MRAAIWILWTSALVAQEATPGVRFEEERLKQLTTVRRVYVDKLTGTTSEQIRDLLMASLQSSKLFIVTENAARADVTLRGTAEDLIYNDTFQSSDGVDMRGNLSTGSGSGKTRQSRTNGLSVGDRESIRFSDRRHEAVVSLRLVNKEGDVIWSTTQESRGGKFRGAAAEVAEKVARQLMVDFEKAKKGPETPAAK